MTRRSNMRRAASRSSRVSRAGKSRPSNAAFTAQPPIPKRSALLARVRSQHRNPDRSGFRILGARHRRRHGEASLFALEAKHGRLPPTREVITGGGGRHLWFKYTGPIQSTTGKIAPGIDTRGDGGYVIVPPSIHPSGRAYEWSVDSGDELAVAPDWLVQLARTKPHDRFRSARSQAIKTAAGSQRATSDAYGSAALDREIEALAGHACRAPQPCPEPRSVLLIPTGRRRRTRSRSSDRAPDRCLPSQWSRRG